MTEEKYPPKVEFKLNEKEWLQFSWDKPTEGEGQFGKWYRWGVKQWVNKKWIEATLFPSHKLVLLLLNIPVKKGSTYEIVQLPGENLKSKKLFKYFEVAEVKGGKPISEIYSTIDMPGEEEGEEGSTPNGKTPPPEEPAKEKGAPRDTEKVDPIDIMESCAVGVCEMISKLQGKYPDLQMTDGLSKMIVSVFIAKTKNV